MGSRIMTVQHMVNATFTASSEESTLPALNLAVLEFRDQGWRATGCASEYVDIVLDEERSINLVVISNFNFSYDATITIGIGSAPGLSDLHSETLDAWPGIWGYGEPGYGLHGYGGGFDDDEVDANYASGTLIPLYLSAEVIAKYIRVTITDPTNADGYVEAGLILVGGYVESSGETSRLATRPEDPSLVTYADGGQKWREDETPYRTSSFQYNNLGDEAYDVWYSLIRTIGVGVMFFLDGLPDVDLLSLRLSQQMLCHIPQGGINDIETEPPIISAVSLSVREDR